MRSQLQSYTTEEVATHNSPKSCWVIFKGRVFDVTDFIEDHPGGYEVIMDFAGLDITEVFFDKLSHTHSENAEFILLDFLIGDVRDSVKDDGDHAENFNLTDPAQDLKEEQFLDLTQPLLEQMFFNNFSKEFYLEQVHKPRYTKESPRFFTSSFLEMFTLTEWYVVPLFWFPIITFLGYLSSFELPLNQVALFFGVGLFSFTLVEYVIHRYVFHLDELLPDHPLCFFFHFMIHGVHHYIPMDRMRLVLPPILSGVISAFLLKICYLLTPNHAIGNSVMGGILIGYVAYDLMHYYIHHGTMTIDYFKIMKSYHMAHHHINYSVAYGVTTKLWDYCLNTLYLPSTPNNISLKVPKN